jgi:hypothetical protein
MSVADATRFDMLKNPTIAEISQISDAPQPLAIAVFHRPRLACQLDRKIEHRTLPLRQPRGAIIHHHQFAKHRIAGILPDRRAMRHETIITTVLRRHRDRDHLALGLAKA